MEPEGSLEKLWGLLKCGYVLKCFHILERYCKRKCHLRRRYVKGAGKNGGYINRRPKENLALCWIKEN